MARTALPGRLTWQLGTVVELIDETPRCKSIVFDLPDWRGHRAGQHVDLRLTAEAGCPARADPGMARELDRPPWPGRPHADRGDRLAAPGAPAALRLRTHRLCRGRRRGFGGSRPRARPHQDRAVRTDGNVIEDRDGAP